MKPEDITEHDHPLAWYTWKKDELEFINARVKLAYEEGQKQTVSRAVEEIMELTKRIAELEAAQPEQSEPVGEVVQIDIDDDGQPSAWVDLYDDVELGTKLYTAPPLRELSGDEIMVIIEATKDCNKFQFARAIIAAARSKTP